MLSIYCSYNSLNIQYVERITVGKTKFDIRNVKEKVKKMALVGNPIIQQNYVEEETITNLKLRPATLKVYKLIKERKITTGKEIMQETSVARRTLFLAIRRLYDEGLITKQYLFCSDMRKVQYEIVESQIVSA